MKFNRKYLFILCYTILFPFVAMAQKGNTDYQYALIEAVKQKNLGNIPGAIELYKMVIAENDSVAVAHYELGTLLALTTNKEEAINHLKKAVELDPNSEAGKRAQELLNSH